MHDDIVAAVDAMVEESAKTRKQIADEIGKPYTTLMRELNQADELAKLGARDLVPLMNACGGLHPLEHLASRMGCRLVMLAEACPDKADLRDEILDDHPPLLGFHQAVRGGRVSTTEAHRLMQKAIRELEETYQSYRGRHGSANLHEIKKQAG